MGRIKNGRYQDRDPPSIGARPGPGWRPGASQCRPQRPGDRQVKAAGRPAEFAWEEFFQAEIANAHTRRFFNRLVNIRSAGGLSGIRQQYPLLLTFRAHPSQHKTVVDYSA